MSSEPARAGPNAIVSAYDALLKAFGFLAGSTFAALSVAISIDVLLRNLNVFSSAALLEITEYALFATTFLAAPWVLAQGAHVRVDLVISSVPKAFARLLEIIADIAGLVIVGLLGWHGLRVTYDSFTRGDVILKHLAVTEWWLLAIIPVSCAMLSVEFLRRLSRALKDGPLDLTAKPSDGL